MWRWRIVSGYDRGDPAGAGRRGIRATVYLKNRHAPAPVRPRLAVPRDRKQAGFDPQLVPKRKRRLGSTSDIDKT